VLPRRLARPRAPAFKRTNWPSTPLLNVLLLGHKSDNCPRTAAINSFHPMVPSLPLRAQPLIQKPGTGTVGAGWLENLPYDVIAPIRPAACAQESCCSARLRPSTGPRRRGASIVAIIGAWPVRRRESSAQPGSCPLPSRRHGRNLS
jgi:hypothetical protein